MINDGDDDDKVVDVELNIFVSLSYPVRKIFLFVHLDIVGIEREREKKWKSNFQF